MTKRRIKKCDGHEMEIQFASSRIKKSNNAFCCIAKSCMLLSSEGYDCFFVR